MSLTDWPQHPKEIYPPEFNALSSAYREAMINYYIGMFEAAHVRLKIAHHALNVLASQMSGKPGSAARADCMAAIAKTAVEQIGEVPQ